MYINTRKFFGYLALSSTTGIVLHLFERWFWQEEPVWEAVAIVSFIVLISLWIYVAWSAYIQYESVRRIDAAIGRTISGLKRKLSTAITKLLKQ
jgi:hypothetical protein